MTSWTKIHRIIHHGQFQLDSSLFQMVEDTKVEEEVGERTRKKDEAYVFSFWSFHNIIICLICFSSSDTSSIFPRGTGPTIFPPSSSPQTPCPLWLRFQAPCERTCFFFCLTFSKWYFHSPGCSSFWSPPHWPALSRGIQAKRQHAPARGIFPSIEFWPDFQVYLVVV